MITSPDAYSVGLLTEKPAYINLLITYSYLHYWNNFSKMQEFFCIHYITTY